MPERRRHPRLKLDIDVELESESNFFGAKSLDLSEGGLFIATDVPLPIGAQVDVSFLLGARRIEATTEVMWALEDEAGATHGVGVRFLEVVPEERDAILEFMRRRDPMLFETAKFVAVPAADDAPAEPRPPRPGPKPGKPGA